MNCKRGELAIVLRSRCGFEGVIVEIVAWQGRLLSQDGWIEDAWQIKFRGSLRHPTNPNSNVFARDCDLRPLRGGELKITESEALDVCA